MTESSSSSSRRVPGEPEIDTTVAHVARVYDYLLGGVDNFAVDREVAEAANRDIPGGIERSKAYVRANRRFLGRVVRYLALDAGVDQFLDIGTGIPNADNVHSVLQEVAPDARLVSVDNDSVVLAHAHTLRTGGGTGRSVFVQGDLRDSRAVLASAGETLDLAKPVAVLLISMMHLFPDADDPHQMVRAYVDAIVPGSYLALSHLSSESPEMTQLGEAVEAAPTTNYSLIPRSHDAVSRFFDGLELVAPGVVFIDDWRPDLAPGIGDQPFGPTPFHGGLAQKLHPAA